jgi:hypothetical protein
VEVLAFAKQRIPFQVQFGLKKHFINTGIYRYSDGGISVFGICDIDPLYFFRCQEIYLARDSEFIELTEKLAYKFSHDPERPQI